MKAGSRGIKLDPNDWYDALYWFEDEPDVYDFMVENEDTIKQYGRDMGRTLKDSIDILYKEMSNDKEKESKGV